MNKKQRFSKKWFVPLFIIILIIVIVWVVWIWLPCPDQRVTTVFLVRHAEYDPNTDSSGVNPDLSGDGEQRANVLANVLSKVEIDTIFSTDTSRTKGTATPLNVSQGVSITIYSDLDLLVNKIRQNHVGEKVVIVGHAPTVPNIINKFVGSPQGYSIGNEFYKIFIVSIPESGNPWVVELKYGEVP